MERPKRPQRPPQNQGGQMGQGQGQMNGMQQGFDPRMQQGFDPRMQQGFDPRMQQGYNQQISQNFNQQGFNQQMQQNIPLQKQQGFNQGFDSVNNQNVPLSPEEMMMQQLLEQKKKRNKLILKVVIGILVAIVAGIGIYFIATGRISGRVTELEAQVERLEQDKIDLKTERDNKVAELEQALQDTTVKELIPTTSLQRVEATDVPELWLPEGDFIAPNPLAIPETIDGVNDSYVQIGQKFVFRPSDRWTMISQGATYEFSHPQKIWGKIRSLTAKNEVLQEEMQPLIQSFFVGYPATTITYRKIFIDDKVVGMIGKAQVTVNYTEDGNKEIEVPVEQEVDVPYEVTEEYEEEVPVMETITNEDGTTSEVQAVEIITNEDGTTTEIPKIKIEKKTRTVIKYEKKTVTVMQKQQTTETITLQKDMVINVGFVQKSGYVLSFLFVNDAEGGSNSQELFDLLIKSGSFGVNGSSLKLE